MADPIKLAEVSEPKLIIDMLDGSKKELDPWELAENIQKGVVEGGGANVGFGQMFDIIRKAAGLPTQAEVDASTADPKPHTLSRNACMKLQSAVNKFVEGFEQVKK